MEKMTRFEEKALQTVREMIRDNKISLLDVIQTTQVGLEYSYLAKGYEIEVDYSIDPTTGFQIESAEAQECISNTIGNSKRRFKMRFIEFGGCTTNAFRVLDVVGTSSYRPATIFEFLVFAKCYPELAESQEILVLGNMPEDRELPHNKYNAFRLVRPGKFYKVGYKLGLKAKIPTIINEPADRHVEFMPRTRFAVLESI
ncbi:MAG: hypothetical protein HY931_02995 [Candidatus Falkowbacteria bacterium]|nr:MAG: hypothetical protein HY931_02995 [Candidatus Falkowbacteria bacterium]